MAKLKERYSIRACYLCARDMARAARFYEAFFERPAAVRNPLYSVFDIGGVRLGVIGEWGAPPPSPRWDAEARVPYVFIFKLVGGATLTQPLAAPAWSDQGAFPPDNAQRTSVGAAIGRPWVLRPWNVSASS